MTSKFFVQCIIKQLLDSVLVISRIIKVSVRVISLSLRLRLITLTSTLIILDITKTSSNNCLLFFEIEVNSGRIFTELRSGEVNILPLFTEIEKNNCFSIYTGSDLNNISRRKPLKIDLIDLRNTGEKRVYIRHFVFVWLTHYSLGRG